MNNKKVLFITTSLLEGGAGKMVHHIAGVLAHDNPNIYALAINKERIVKKDENVHYLAPLCVHDGGIKGFCRTIKAIRSLVKNERPDVVISFVSDVAVCTRIATIGLRNTFIISAERGDPFSLNVVWRILTRWAYRYSDWCFFQLNKARDFYGSSVIKKSTVIPNAAFFDGEIGSHRSSKMTIVSAGRFVWEKGYDLLIDAFKIVHDKHPDYSMVLYGDGNLKKQYEDRVELLGLTGLVTFPGYIDNVAAAIKSDDIFVLPSRLEGIPNVLIEALLTGIPTVSCDCNPGGPSFLTDGGERGIIVPMENVPELANGILKLIEDRDLYKKFEKNGPQIIEKLSPSVIERQWIDAFRQITSIKIS